MHFQRRRLFRIVTYFFASSFISGRKQLGLAAQTGAQPTDSPGSAWAVLGHGLIGGAEMEKVTGIGGLFFRAHDPKALAFWYQQHLGVSLTHRPTRSPLGGKRPDLPFSLLSKRRLTISGMPTRSGW